jgi:D-amino-acid oxidase
MRITRRALLQGLSASLLLPAACKKLSRPKLSPVRVSADNVLKTVVGLRPFRKPGFVVRSEVRGEQTIVHNYGHGGAGVTLSWGTAMLAVEHVLRTRATKVAVIGCGAVGLATARLLQQKGIEATIYAKDLPPNTTSNIAGARWYPFDVFDSAVATPEFLATLWRIASYAYGVFHSMIGDEYGIYTRPSYACRTEPFAKQSLLNFDSPIADLLPGLRDLDDAEKPFPFPIVRTFESMMIEPGIYLPAVMRDHARAGGTIIQRDFATADDFASLSERTIVNCTGLGAATLFGDTELYPIKGQLTILKPQPEIDYLAFPPDLYMFPRTDGIVLGGTFEHHVYTMEPDRVAEARIMAAHATFFAGLQS